MGELRPMIDQGLAMLRRRRWLAAAVFVVAFAACMTAVRSLPVLYQSTTLVAIEEQQVPEALVKSTVTGQLEARLLKMSQELLSQARLEELVNRFSLYPELRSHATTAALGKQLRREIELEVRGVQSKVRGTPVMALSISYRGNDPTTVPAVVNALASGYVEENTRLRERQALGTSDFLKTHLREASERLDQQEQKVSAFKRRYLGELPEQSQANLATIERLNDQLRNTREAQIRARERIEQRAQTNSLTTSLRALAGDTGAPPGETATARIDRLKQELVELRLRFSDKYPDVTQKQAEIAALERLVAAGGLSVSDGPPRRPSATVTHRRHSAVARREEDELRLLNDEEKRLRAEIAIYQGRIENTPKREQEFLELSRDYDSTKELYGTLLKRYEEAQMAGNLEHRQKGEQFRILEPANPATAGSPGACERPRSPSWGRWLWRRSRPCSSTSSTRRSTLRPTCAGSRRYRCWLPFRRSSASVTSASVAQLALGSVATAVAVVLFAGMAHYAAKGNQQIVLMLMRFGI